MKMEEYKLQQKEEKEKILQINKKIQSQLITIQKSKENIEQLKLDNLCWMNSYFSEYTDEQFALDLYQSKIFCLEDIKLFFEYNSQKTFESFLKENNIYTNLIKTKNINSLSTEEIQKLKIMPYKEYLQTEHWKNIRKIALRLSGYKCHICSSNFKLNVHHKTYEHRGEENQGYNIKNDLVVLCENCHSKFHNKLI